jgi:murein DD-endopeptidase MepM/ murein hydrolase activator NlpD
VLDGKVAAVINNRFPYGNMVIIESPITAIPDAGKTDHPLPTREPIQTPDPALTCPAGKDDYHPKSGDLSLYLLYAHLNQPVNLKIGEKVTCGQVIGAVGTTGNSVNYHLHLETRIGPSGAIFDSLGHYMNNVTEQEMHNYCMWRVSGVFQMVDPMIFFSVDP